MTNRSEPVLCAEKDNVAVAFSAPNVRSFRIEAAHPAYLGGIQRDSFEADWTACDMSADPSFKTPTPPRRVTLYEEIEFWLVGHTQESYWRPSTATRSPSRSGCENAIRIPATAFPIVRWEAKPMSPGAC